jgi:hypothetical protein
MTENTNARFAAIWACELMMSLGRKGTGDPEQKMHVLSFELKIVRSFFSRAALACWLTQSTWEVELTIDNVTVRDLACAS